MAGEPLVNVNEDAPLRPDSKALYSATKAQAEQVVRAANDDSFETVVVRPRLVWGAGDTTILPGLVQAVEKGRFAWIGGGQHRTSTTHVDNVIQGLMLGAERGRPGGVYFVTDGEPVVFRDFITQLLATQGVTPGNRNMPAPVARAMAAGAEGIWRTFRLGGTPPLTRLTYWLSAQECTIDISRARDELGYQPVRSIPEGMQELRGRRLAGPRESPRASSRGAAASPSSALAFSFDAPRSLGRHARGVAARDQTRQPDAARGGAASRPPPRRRPAPNRASARGRRPPRCRCRARRAPSPRPWRPPRRPRG